MILDLFYVTLGLLFVYIINHKRFSDSRVFVTGGDNRRYKVQNISSKNDSANALARVNSKIIDFIKRLESDGETEFKPMIKRIATRYDPNSLAEGRHSEKQFTSYTVNKGEELVLCLRSRDQSDTMHDDNLLFYVTLHELAHIGSLSEHHTQEFHHNFRFLMRKASDWGFFKRVREPFKYCGLDVHSM
jgi:hypothetical protein